LQGLKKDFLLDEFLHSTSMPLKKCLSDKKGNTGFDLLLSCETGILCVFVFLSACF